ncbi:MAG: PEP-CTERM sorting domain-containing protein [Gammaproteobacteria bacterium]|nr:PEP-CTERM sorting domain-containing protein [Gammaproteobacteria bacterium]
MKKTITTRIAAIAAVTSLMAGSQASEILYAQDYASGADNMATVLSGDGHAVTSLLGGYNGATDINNDLLGDLSAYDAVIWSASGPGFGGVHAAGQFDDLLTYVNGGGMVFVTGYDSIASPTDLPLAGFLGGSDSRDFGGSRDPLAITGANSLSTGLFDIQGVTPTGAWGDWDTLLGLGADTECVAAANGGAAGACQWSLRSLGLGEIAYVSAGASGANTDTAWNDPANAYNNALRNFAFNAGTSAPAVPEPGTLGLLGAGLLGFALSRKKRA